MVRYQQSVDDTMSQLADDPAVLQQRDHDQLTSTAGTDESLDEWFERELPDLVE
jgi:hypothetical protein